MVLNKLQEALAEVNSQRKALDEVERQLRAMIASLSGDQNITYPAARTVLPPQFGEPRDRIDDIADIIRKEGKPLHIGVIAERLSRAEKTVSRTDIEPGLNRHIAKAKRVRVAKFGPSTYGLPEWKGQHQDMFAESA
jgi:hypothetical protein